MASLRPAWADYSESEVSPDQTARLTLDKQTNGNSTLELKTIICDSFLVYCTG